MMYYIKNSKNLFYTTNESNSSDWTDIYKAKNFASVDEAKEFAYKQLNNIILDLEIVYLKYSIETIGKIFKDRDLNDRIEQFESYPTLKNYSHVLEVANDFLKTNKLSIENYIKITKEMILDIEDLGWNSD